MKQLSFVCLSKFVSAANILSFVFSMSWDISWSYSNVKFLSASLPLGHLYIFHHNHFYYLFPFFVWLHLFSQSSYIPRVPWRVALPSFPHPALLSFNLCLISVSLPTLSLLIFFLHFHLSWWIPFLSSMLGKMSCGFITEREGGNTSANFADCVWTE